MPDDEPYPATSFKSFKVTKNYGDFTVKTYNNDLKTGNVTIDQHDYSAYFGTDRTEADHFLHIMSCWFRYPHIRVDLICDHYHIPAVISSSEVQGDYGTSSPFAEDLNDAFTVEIIREWPSNSSCAIRTESHTSKKLYYTPQSKFYEDLVVYGCFDSEAEAKEAGYEKSLN